MFGFVKTPRFAFAIIAFLYSGVAHANVGIPVVSFGLPFMLLNLVAVVLIETAVMKYLRRDLKFLPALSTVAVANLITTVIGYPVVAGLEAMSALVGLNLGWILPYSGLDQMGIYVSTTLFLTLIPSYFLSVWIEGKWLRRIAVPSKVVWLANLASYVFLTIQVYLLPPTFLLGFGKYTAELSFVVIMKIVSLFVQGR